MNISATRAPPKTENRNREEPAIILPFSGSSFRVLSNRAIDSSFFKILRKTGAFPREVITARSELTPTKSPFRSAEHQHVQKPKVADELFRVPLVPRTLGKSKAVPQQSFLMCFRSVQVVILQFLSFGSKCCFSQSVNVMSWVPERPCRLPCLRFAGLGSSSRFPSFVCSESCT